jgi:hypothetical protein
MRINPRKLPAGGTHCRRFKPSGMLSTGKVGTDISGDCCAFIFSNIAVLTSIFVPRVVVYLVRL